MLYWGKLLCNLEVRETRNRNRVVRYTTISEKYNITKQQPKHKENMYLYLLVTYTQDLYENIKKYYYWLSLGS